MAKTKRKKKSAAELYCKATDAGVGHGFVVRSAERSHVEHRVQNESRLLSFFVHVRGATLHVFAAL